jgi:glycosyltransferase involved in cell wall biosynthesis
MAVSAFDVRIATFVAPAERPEWADVLRADGVPVHAFPVRSPYDASAVRALRDHLRREAVDVVCSHDYRTSVLVFLAVRGTRARWVAFSRGVTRENLKVRAFHAASTALLRAADAVVAVSAGEAARLRRARIPARKIAVVHNAVPLAAFDAVEARDLRAENGFRSEDVVCVAVGRFSPEKGQDLLVSAAAEALPRVPALRFLIYGDGPDLARVRSRVAALGLADRVRCPGHVRDAVARIKGADLLVHPSLSEGLPNAILEAMAVGTPVVATAVGGVPELVRADVTGVAVPPRAADLAKALEWGATHRADLDRMAAAAREHLARAFTFERQATLLQDVYARSYAHRQPFSPS